MGSLAALSEYLLADKTAIVDCWFELCGRDHHLDVVGRLTRDEFRNNMPAALEALCKMLVAGADRAEAALEKEVAEHGQHRWKQGFDLLELIRDWGHFNRVLTERIDAFFRDGDPSQAEDRSAALRCLADYLTEAVSHSVERFDDLRRAEASSIAADLEITKQRFVEVTQARGNLLRQIAHDIRGGLSSVTGASRYLRDLSAQPETFSEVLDVLDRGVQAVLEMLTSLLDLSRIESGAERREVSELNIGQLLTELGQELQPLAREQGLALVAEGDRHLIVETDGAKVRRIAQNLLVNAIKYTHEGEVRLRWSRTDDHWQLEVEDTGPGIQDTLGSEVAQELDDQDSARPALHAERPAAYEGEGIGLTIVKELCNLLDAGISMQSAPGHGTRFTLEFPLTYEPRDCERT